MEKRAKKVAAFVVCALSHIVKQITGHNGVCRYTPSCSAYAQEAIERLPLWKAVPRIVLRLLRCQPMFRGGYDPVVRSREG